jgi:hypothetical protein
VDTEVGKDDLPYSILTYANGPGFNDHLEVHKVPILRLSI